MCYDNNDYCSVLNNLLVKFIKSTQCIVYEAAFIDNSEKYLQLNGTNMDSNRMSLVAYANF